jgi:hypothetical protein
VRYGLIVATLMFAGCSPAVGESADRPDVGVDVGPTDTGVDSPLSLCLAMIAAETIGQPGCAYLRRCCTSRERTIEFALALTYGTICADEGASMAADCAALIASGTSSGRVTFDASSARTCIEAVRALPIRANETCNGPDPYAGQAPRPAFATLTGCKKALVGQQAAEKPCAADFECADGACRGALRDSSGRITREGQCAARIADGAECTDKDVCVDGDICREGRCQLRAAKGGACDDDSGCQSGLYCEKGETSSACVPEKSNGSSCTEGSQCMSTVCSGARCAALCIGGGS